MTMILAVVLGAAFGFALNRVGATNPNNIINMLRLSDLHLMKTIMFAVGIASILLFGGMALGLIDPGNLSVKASYSGVVVGGVLLGLGFAVAGYCPGTGLAAAATGRLDGLVFVIGGFAGAFAYMLSYAWVEDTGVLADIFGGKSTLAATGNEAYPALLEALPGTGVAVAIAALMLILAALLPRMLRKTA